MDRFCHLAQMRPLFQAGARVSIDTIGALYGVGHGKRDKRLFPLRQLRHGEHRPIVVKELGGKLWGILSYLGEPAEIVGVVIGLAGHDGCRYLGNGPGFRAVTGRKGRRQLT